MQVRFHKSAAELEHLGVQERMRCPKSAAKRTAGHASHGSRRERLLEPQRAAAWEHSVLTALAHILSPDKLCNKHVKALHRSSRQ
jgi:hypothetical protein